MMCHNCELDEELTTVGYALGSDESVYRCTDEREVNGLLDEPCVGCGPAWHAGNCFVDPREV